MILFDGKKLANEINLSLKLKIKNLHENNIFPGLGIILIGNNKESLAYINMKKKSCTDLKIQFFFKKLPEKTSQFDVIQEIHSMNTNPSIHGILIQLPLPDHLNKDTILDTIIPTKDVDGLHTLNAGNLFQNKIKQFIPCTPRGCIELLDHYNIDVKGLHIVIIGCSNLVGLPLSIMLLHRKATVTICHIDTIDIKKHVQQADLLIACCGVPHLVKKDWVKENVIIIDVGITKVREKKIVGDVDFENVKEKASYITPVPGGIGPMTVAMLMKQTIESAEKSLENLKL